MYLLPRERVYTYGYLELGGHAMQPADIVNWNLAYATLNDQSLLQRYGGANPAAYEFVKASGRLVAQFPGRLYSTAVYAIEPAQAQRLAQSVGAHSLAHGKPVVASSIATPDLAPDLVVDGNIGSRWASAGRGTEWISVDLGQSRTIGRVELYWEAAYARSYELQVSDDSENWSTFYATTTGTGETEVIDAPTRGRYVRLLMTRPVTTSGYSVYELLVYPPGSESETGPVD